MLFFLLLGEQKNSANCRDTYFYVTRRKNIIVVLPAHQPLCNKYLYSFLRYYLILLSINIIIDELTTFKSRKSHRKL